MSISLSRGKHRSQDSRSLQPWFPLLYPQPIVPEPIHHPVLGSS